MLAVRDRQAEKQADKASQVSKNGFLKMGEEGEYFQVNMPKSQPATDYKQVHPLTNALPPLPHCHTHAHSSKVEVIFASQHALSKFYFLGMFAL